MYVNPWLTANQQIEEYKILQELKFQRKSDPDDQYAIKRGKRLHCLLNV